MSFAIRNDAYTVKLVPSKQWCWLCGRTPNAKPPGWHAPFMLETMHVGSGQGDCLRVDDRRCVIAGCSLCHSLHVNHAGGTMNINGVDYPTIDARHTLWVKMKLDRAFYDRKFLAEFWIGTVPIPEKPPQFFLDELLKHQGLSLQ